MIQSEIVQSEEVLKELLKLLGKSFSIENVEPHSNGGGMNVTLVGPTPGYQPWKGAHAKLPPHVNAIAVLESSLIVVKYCVQFKGVQ